SNTLVFGLDPTKYSTFGGNQTSVTYFVAGVGDFGQNVEKLNIWQENFDLDGLISIQLQDDVRQWNEKYQPCSIDYSMNERPLATFQGETSSTDRYPQQCHLFTIENAPATVDYADAKSVSSLIKEDIDQWYGKSDMYADELSITSMILQSQKNDRVILFFSNKTNNDQLIIALIKDLKEKLESHGYVVDDADDDLNSVEELEQIIFICTDQINDHDNRQIMQAVGRKINKRGVLRDVFIFINDAIQHVSCHLIKSVPYLTFDLRVRAAKLTDDEVQEVIDYLNSKIQIFH
ncbi:unnamed protein product, partial [Rotaria sp. Silwood2]